MYEGTLYGQWEALVTFQQMIVLCDADGMIDMTPQAIAARTSIPLRIIKKGIAILEAADPYSRTPDQDGRRIELIDAHRPWGWHIVNHAKYMHLQDADTVREQTRERVKRHREKQRLDEANGWIYLAKITDRSRYKTVHGLLKIGYSKNPLDRLTSEYGVDGYELVDTAPGGRAVEALVLASFTQYKAAFHEFFENVDLIKDSFKQVVTSCNANVTDSNAKKRHTDTDTNTDTPIPNTTYSGATAPFDPDREVWRLGLEVLMAAKVPERQARAILGKHYKRDKAHLLEVLCDMAREPVIDPIPYLEAAMNPKRGHDKVVL